MTLHDVSSANCASRVECILHTFKNATFSVFHFCVMDNIWTKKSM